jgi:hypothetical protein
MLSYLRTITKGGEVQWGGKKDDIEGCAKE